ncbi:hypothetical protein Q5762_10605 [Streptomyces sp. P9(2023)]|uniref:hypothetical protein n=1 Tax=Streptomyces sp. P9(2023) TaxID=3064394 RepID=UPI0028F416EA|nr:hypothetical protein [Streptomyces sp. P9(2023)]MDT9688801.1 hypothetical protein [Streptomyces sp. P9(2023)]
MKQSAAKTLGVAALGAAFAAAAAGTATAAPALPSADGALGMVTSVAPLGDGLTQLPDGAAESLLSGEASVDQGVKTLPAAAGTALEQAPLDSATGALGNTPVGGLLGGLPVGGLAGGLPLG